MEKVLLAIGNTDYSRILRTRFSDQYSHFDVSEQEVMHHNYLDEIVELERPDILIFHDFYLPTNKVTAEDREEEWLSYIQKLRETYDDSIRIVFLCVREKGDPFLSALVNENVLDIFNENTIDMVALIEQLKDKPKYSRVSKFKVTAPAAPIEKRQTIPEEEESIRRSKEENEAAAEPVEQVEEVIEKPAKKEKPQKVIEKKVINKVIEKKINVVNKQVVKRDFHIQVLNQVEKVVGVTIEKKVIAIGSPFSRSGSTFISHLIAKELASKGVSVTYIESPYSTAYSYDRFVGHQNNPNYRSKFYQFTEVIDPRVASEFDWSVEDVSMIAKHPANEPVYSADDVPFDVFIKILLASRSTVTIVDVGTDWTRSVYKDLFDIATDAYFVVEPDISNIQYLEDPDNEATAVYREMIHDDKSVIIGNRFDESLIGNKIIQELYEDKLIALIPEFPSKDVFQSQLEGTFINNNERYRKQIDNCIEPIMSELLPDEFLKKLKKQGRKSKGIFKKRIKIEKVNQEVKK